VSSEADRVQRLRNDLIPPLSALLAETQLLLLNPARMDDETRRSLKEIEALAIRARALLHDS
jgi:hypothetical protein